MTKLKTIIALAACILMASCVTNTKLKSIPHTTKQPGGTIPATQVKNTPKSFNNAKNKAKKIFMNNRESFYCGCSYDTSLKAEHKSCGYEVRKNPTRASRIEWEHIVPASYFGKLMQSKCWTDKICVNSKNEKFKGRECCLKLDPLFNEMHNDLHNLVPAIGEVNADRNNFNFGYLDSSSYKYGKCKVKINIQKKTIEPRDEVKGLVARTYLYYNTEYGMHLDKSQKKLFERWSKQFPPSKWEIERNNRIQQTQGNYNKHVNTNR